MISKRIVETGVTRLVHRPFLLDPSAHASEKSLADHHCKYVSTHARNYTLIPNLPIFPDPIRPASQTQERSVYPKLLSFLGPHSFSHSANLLGWHAEGPFLQQVKRGAHAQPLLVSAPKGITSIEEVYGPENLAPGGPGVRMITAAPELQGIMESIHHLSERGVIFSIGHR
jgi:hypothetical protein